jgi:hypothetical protein
MQAKFPVKFLRRWDLTHEQSPYHKELQTKSNY